MFRIFTLIIIFLFCVPACQFIDLKEPSDTQAVVARVAARSVGQEIAETEYAGDVKWTCKRILEIDATADADDAYVGVLATTLFQHLETSSVMEANIKDIMSLFDFQVHEDTALYVMNLQMVAKAILEGVNYAK